MVKQRPISLRLVIGAFGYTLVLSVVIANWVWIQSALLAWILGVLVGCSVFLVTRRLAFPVWTAITSAISLLVGLSIFLVIPWISSIGLFLACLALLLGERGSQTR